MGIGDTFQLRLQQLGVSGVMKYHESGHRSDLHFAYSEAASQILIMYDPDIQRFLMKLLNSPDMRFFQHIPALANPANFPSFQAAYKEFAMGILFQINHYLGTRLDVDYLLEAAASTYLVVTACPKTTKLNMSGPGLSGSNGPMAPI